MFGKTARTVLVVLIATLFLSSCGEQGKEVSVSTGTSKFTGSFFTVDKIGQDNPVQIGNNYNYGKDFDNLSIQLLPMPGITANDIERTRPVLDNFAKSLIDARVKEVNSNGQKGLMLTGTSGDLEKRFFTLPVTDAVVIITADPIEHSKYDGSSAFEKAVGSFAVTNVDFMKNAGNPPIGDNPTGQKPLAPVEFKNDYMKFMVPEGWEVAPDQRPDSISVTPVSDNQSDSAQGITITVMPKHQKPTDMDFARSQGSKPESVAYGGNTFAKFYIAAVGVYNYVISNQTHTYIISITISGDNMPVKMEKFLETFQMVSQ